MCGWSAAEASAVNSLKRDTLFNPCKPYSLYLVNTKSLA